MRKLLNDKKGIFGLNAVQQFFVIILGIALLAYVIIVIMGTLNDANIIPKGTLSSGRTNSTTVSIMNYTSVLNATDAALSGVSCTVTACRNATSGTTIATANWTYTASTCTVTYTNTSADVGGFWQNKWKCDYTYTYDNTQIRDGKSILNNVSSGVSGFFNSINPVYAILAVLVIILVLVVLVRVVSAPSGSTTGGMREQL